MPKVRIPPPISGGLMLSYKCSATCRHCMYACSPQWKADWMDEQDLERILTYLSRTVQPSPWGKDNMSLNHGLHFTGGEPFLNFELLLTAVEMADEMAIPSTFVETNCSWCGDDEGTREKLERLKGAGLRGIMISVNPFYAEYVPFERTERCIAISQQVFGHNVMVYQMEYYHRFKQLSIRKRLSLADYMALTGDEPLAGRVEMFLMGRAAVELRALYPAHPARRFLVAPSRTPLLRDLHNHFDNYGNFMPGYCGGISLGPWQEMERLTTTGIDLETHPVLAFLIAKDIEGLFHFAQDHGYRERPAGYGSKCDLCLDIRSHLVARENLDLEELMPKQFYAQLR